MTSPFTSRDRQVAAPAPGQLVTVRNRQWVAADVSRSEVASSDPHVLTGRVPHLVTLASIEDDAWDDELRVVWELEPSTVVHEVAVLPSPEHGFDEPSELAAFLHAVRWGAIASADTTALQAPFRSGIQIEDYQLDPVVRALSMPRTNLSVAPAARPVRQPVDALPPVDRQRGLAQARAPDAAAARGAAASAALPAGLRPAGGGRGAQLRAV